MFAPELALLAALAWTQAAELRAGEALHEAASPLETLAAGQFEGQAAPGATGHQDEPDERMSRQVLASEGLPWTPVALLSLVIGAFAVYRAWNRKRSAQPQGAVEFVAVSPRAERLRHFLYEEQASFIEALEDGESAMEAEGQRSARKRKSPVIDIDSRRLPDEE